MYVSRLSFHTVPGKTGEVAERLGVLKGLVATAGGQNARILRTHFASLGAPDLVFEQEAADLTALESQIAQVTASEEFRRWSNETSALLTTPPLREIYITD